MISVPPKKVAGSPVIQVDLISQLPLGVSLSSATATVTVTSGTDATPSTLLSGSPTVSSTIVNLPTAVGGGVAGVIYNIKVDATGSDGKHYIEDVVVAVLA